MAKSEFVRFLGDLRENPQRRAEYSARNLSQLLFHASDEGFRFTAEELVSVVGALEIEVIVAKDGEPVDGGSTLWRHMWGRRYLDYLLDHVVARFGEEELRGFAADERRPVA